MPIDLPRHECSLTLEHNDYKSYYTPIQQAVLEIDTKDSLFDWVSSEQRQKALDTGEIWTIQWYPRTPIGFYSLAAADLDVLLETACAVT